MVIELKNDISIQGQLVSVDQFLNVKLDQIQVLDRTRTLAPNVYTVYLHSQDYDRFAAWEDTLLDELQRLVMEHADKQRYMFVGAVSVDLQRDDEVRAGRFETESRTERGSVAPATGAAQSASGGNPIIEIDGQQYLLTGPVTVIGRGGDADIILEDTGVSRHHLELRAEEDGTLIATDLGSTNGSLVDGQRLRGRTELVNGAVIEMGRTRIVFRLVAPRRNRKNV